MVKSLGITNMHLNNKEQECKTGPVRGWILVGGGRGMKRVKEGKYGQCTLYTYMKKTENSSNHPNSMERDEAEGWWG
jgi:hypothetical protein